MYIGKDIMLAMQTLTHVLGWVQENGKGKPSVTKAMMLFSCSCNFNDQVQYVWGGGFLQTVSEHKTSQITVVQLLCDNIMHA